MRDLIPKMETLSWVYALPVLVLTLSLLAVTIWAYGGKRKAVYERMAKLPLADHSDETDCTIGLDKHR